MPASGGTDAGDRALGHEFCPGLRSFSRSKVHKLKGSVFFRKMLQQVRKPADRIASDGYFSQGYSERCFSTVFFS